MNQLRNAWNRARRLWRSAVFALRIWFQPGLDVHPDLGDDGEFRWAATVDDRLALIRADVARLQKVRVLHRDDLNDIIARWSIDEADRRVLSRKAWDHWRRLDAQRRL